MERLPRNRPTFASHPLHEHPAADVGKERPSKNARLYRIIHVRDVSLLEQNIHMRMHQIQLSFRMMTSWKAWMMA